MRLLAVSTVWSSISGSGSGGRSATHRYEELRRQQLLGWGLQQRGRYSSFSGLLSIPASYISGMLLRLAGTRKSLFVGQISDIAEKILQSASTTTAHFYALRPLRLTSDVSPVAMAYATTAIGDQAGFKQGELNSSLSNLRVICRIGSPLLWGKIFSYGVDNKMPSFFLLVSAAAGLAQLGLLSMLTSGLDLTSRKTKK